MTGEEDSWRSNLRQQVGRWRRVPCLMQRTHAVKKIEELKNKDLHIAEEVEILRRMLEA